MEPVSTAYSHYNRNETDEFRSRSDGNDVLRFIMTERGQLTEDDSPRFENRQDSITEFHTLENLKPVAVSYDPCVVPEPTNHDSRAITTSRREADFEPDLEMLVDSAGSDMEDEETEFSKTVTSYIQDEKVRNSILAVNKQIDDNAVRYRREAEEARAIVARLQNLKRELYSIQVRIETYSVEDAKLKKIQKKRGTACAKTLSNRRTYFCRFGIPYFKTKDRFPADHNEDLKQIIKNNQIMFVRMPKVPRFLRSDIRALDHAVLEQLKTKRIHQLELRLKHLKSEEDDSDHEQKKRNLKVAIDNTRRTTDIKETQPWNIPVDFMSLSEINTRFTHEDYERMWNLLGNPKFNRTSFSEEEFAKLRSLVEKNGAQNWERIATALGTNHSGYMCFTNYARSNRKGKNQPWTKEEDELLLKLCSRLNFMKKSDTPEYWRNIRRQFPNRSYSALHSHWKYVLQPTLKKGRFSAEEHEKLKQLIKEGKSFSEIARIVQNRSVVQLRSHYNQIVAQATNTSQGAWTRQEEDKLVELVKKYGKTNWVAISNEMGTRNRVQCRLKYLTLCTKEAAALLRDGTAVSMKKWLPDETKLFKQLLETHGTDFSKISSLMETKTARECTLKYRRLRRTQDCVDVYKRTLKIKHGRRWTPAEKRRFEELVQKYGSQFAIISEELGTRDVRQCEQRYAVMCRVKQRAENQSEGKRHSKNMRGAKQCNEETCNNEQNNEKEHEAQQCDQKLRNEEKSAAKRGGKKTCKAKQCDEQMYQEKQDETKKCGVERRKKKCKPKQSCEDLCEAKKKQDNKTKCRATRRSKKIYDVEGSDQSMCGAKPRITNLIAVRRISNNVDIILQTVPEGPGNQKVEYGEEHGNIVV